MMKLQGSRQLESRLRAVQNTPQSAMRRLGLRAVREQKLLVPRKTGNLGRTIRLERVTAEMAITIAGANYAGAVEFGTRPHVIRPRTKRFLRFPAQGAARTLSGRARKGSRMTFARVVHHPGTKAQPYMVPGAQKALADEGFAVQIVDAWNSAA